MKLSAAIISSTLFATAIFAAPTATTKRTHRRTHPLIRVPGPHGVEKVEGNKTADDYSTNWAGAVLTAPPSGETFNAVSGQFTVPTLSVPSGDSAGAYSGCAWVGIDGDTYGGAILQAGVDWTVDDSSGSNQYSYSAWYEWFPDPQITIDGFGVNAGDVITVDITSQSSSSGTVVITNESSGQSVTETSTAPNADATLQGVNAEWIVEDYSVNGGLVPFANFGSMSITSCAAGTPAGGVDTTGADILELVDSNNNVVVSANQASGSEIDFTYQ